MNLEVTKLGWDGMEVCCNKFVATKHLSLRKLIAWFKDHQKYATKIISREFKAEESVKARTTYVNDLQQFRNNAFKYHRNEIRFDSLTNKIHLF